MELPETFNEATLLVAIEISNLLIRKQQDYGKANIEEFGEFGVLLRANDKLARLKNLIFNNKQAANESRTDSWKDIAGYAIIALMLERGWFALPPAKD